MDIPTLIASGCGVLTALGGWKLVEWLLNRNSNKRIAEANAESIELKNERDEFHFLRERLEYKDEAMMEKEKRFIEQTELVRLLNRQLLDQTIENGKLQARISALEAERAMKLCEKRGCLQRQPQSGY
jgi:hypothetical protein